MVDGTNRACVSPPTVGLPFIPAHSRDWGVGGGGVGARGLHSPHRGTPAAP